MVMPWTGSYYGGESVEPAAWPLRLQTPLHMMPPGRLGNLGAHLQPAAAMLASRGEELARAAVTEQFAESPELLDKYGEPGREKCVEDMRHTIRFLAPGVALDEPSLFREYVDWLAELLAARGIPVSEVVRSLELLRQVVVERVPAPEARAIAAVIDAGLEALDAPAPR